MSFIFDLYLFLLSLSKQILLIKLISNNDAIFVKNPNKKTPANGSAEPF